MADEESDPQEGQVTGRHSYPAPSRRGLVSVAAYVSKDARQELRMIALQQSTTLQRLLCMVINDLLEKNGRGRLADEADRPRGGAAHKRG